MTHNIIEIGPYQLVLALVFVLAAGGRIPVSWPQTGKRPSGGDHPYLCTIVSAGLCAEIHLPSKFGLAGSNRIPVHDRFLPFGLFEAALRKTGLPFSGLCYFP